MKITEVEAILLKGDEVYGSAAGADEAVDQGDWQVIVRVATDEGLTGYSDVETLSTAAAEIINGRSMSVTGFLTLDRLLIGRDPLDVEGCWTQMYIGSNYYGRRGIVMQCMSAIDNCLWSIRGQAEGRPLYELLGGKRRERVRAYASTLFRRTPEGCAAAARRYVELGFTAVKFGWGVFGSDEKRDRELVAAAREGLGAERDLLVDPGWYGSGWDNPTLGMRSREANLAMCEWLESYDVGWVEDFVHPELFEDYAWVREQAGVPIAAGEQVATVWEFERFIEEGCVDVAQPDLSRCGGMTVARRVATMADAAGIDLVPHSWLTDLLTGYSLHLIATLERALYVEFNVAQSGLTRGVCGGAIGLDDDGTVRVPTGVGLGVEVDTDFIAGHRVN
ncbi:MAG: hypothetical protein CMJ49_03865 [Planctomycetaceae bacterium]|nr:hypothetical protein [Planctomycetaceae bacterium]